MTSPAGPVPITMASNVSVVSLMGCSSSLLPVISRPGCAEGVDQDRVEGQAQQEVGSCSPGSKSFAANRRLSAIVRYGAQVSAMACTVI